MSIWTTVTVETNPDLPSSPGAYVRAFSEGLADDRSYDYAEGDGCVVIAVYGTHDVDDALDALFDEYINRYLCPRAIVTEVEDTGDGRDLRVVRPPEKGDGGVGDASRECVDERSWIDRPDEGDPEVDDEVMIDAVEGEYGVTVTTKRDPHLATPSPFDNRGGT